MWPCAHTLSAVAVAQETAGVSHTLMTHTPVGSHTLQCPSVPWWGPLGPPLSTVGHTRPMLGGRVGWGVGEAASQGGLKTAAVPRLYQGPQSRGKSNVCGRGGGGSTAPSAPNLKAGSGLQPTRTILSPKGRGRGGGQEVWYQARLRPESRGLPLMARQLPLRVCTSQALSSLQNRCWLGRQQRLGLGAVPGRGPGGEAYHFVHALNEGGRQVGVGLEMHNPIMGGLVRGVQHLL